MPILTDLTEEQKKELNKAIKGSLENEKRALTITERITKLFEKEGWKQNEYWELEDGVLCASFIDYELEQISVFVDYKKEMEEW